MHQAVLPSKTAVLTEGRAGTRKLPAHVSKHSPQPLGCRQGLALPRLRAQLRDVSGKCGALPAAHLGRVKALAGPCQGLPKRSEAATLLAPCSLNRAASGFLTLAQPASTGCRAFHRLQSQRLCAPAPTMPALQCTLQVLACL